MLTNINKKVAIIQTSPGHTASTLLFNAILGFILSDKPAHFIWSPIKAVENPESWLIKRINNFKKRFKHSDILIFKTHFPFSPESPSSNWQQYWVDEFGTEYEYYFISSERTEKGIHVDADDRTLVIPYEVLLETSSRSLKDVVDSLHDEFSKFLPDHIYLDKMTCLERLRKMNERVSEMQNEPFSVVDKFYNIHGGHRNRPDRKLPK